MLVAAVVCFVLWAVMGLIFIGRDVGEAAYAFINVMHQGLLHAGYVLVLVWGFNLVSV